MGGATAQIVTEHRLLELFCPLAFGHDLRLPVWECPKRMLTSAVASNEGRQVPGRIANIRLPDSRQTHRLLTLRPIRSY